MPLFMDCLWYARPVRYLLCLHCRGLSIVDLVGDVSRNLRRDPSQQGQGSVEFVSPLKLTFGVG